MISAAPSATWTSVSPGSRPTVNVQTNVTGCQAGAAGAVLSLQQVVLEDGTQASKALETNPLGRPSASITGVYTIPATTAGEVFRAEVGFCWGVASATQMTYKVGYAGSSEQPGSPEALTSTGRLTSVDVPLPAGTTQITLTVSSPNIPGVVYGDVVWVNPRVEAASAPAPSLRPTVTKSPLPTLQAVQYASSV